MSSVQVYTFSKPFAFSELQSMKAFLGVCASLKDSYIERNWPELRRLLMGEAREGHIARLEQEVRRHLPHAPAVLDAWFANTRSAGSSAAEKAFPRLAEGRLPEEVRTCVLGWLYWKYSNDFLGVGKGLSKTLLGNVLDRLYFLGSTRNVTWLAVPIRCPHCSGTAEFAAVQVEPLYEELRGTSMECSSCGHREFLSADDSESISAVSCDCSHCAAVRVQAAADARRLVAPTITDFAKEIRELTAQAFALVDVQPGPPDQPLSPSGEKFCEVVDAHPSAPLPQLLEACWLGGRTRGIAHPYHTLNEAWNILPQLISDGLVDAYLDERGLPADDHLLVEIALRSRDQWWGRGRNSDQKVHALSTFIMGPRSADKEHLQAWLDGADELGFEQSWGLLPLKFQFAVNRDRLRDVKFGEGVDFQPALVEVYACRNQPWWVQDSEELKNLRGELRQPIGFTDEGRSLLETLRTKVAPGMAAKHAEEYQTLTSPGGVSLESAAEDVRNGQRDRMTLHSPTGAALARFLYWSLCREAIGEADGVPLKRVMDYFGANRGAFGKLIEEVSIPKRCPGCSGPGEASSIRLKAPHDIASARFNCASCGHTEAFGLNEPNQLVCACQTCSMRRDEALANAASAAEGIAERMVAIASQLADGGRYSELLDSSGGPSDKAFGSYAQLRVLGRSPDESAHLVFYGTLYGETTSEGFWPAWATQRAFDMKVLRVRSHQELRGAEALRFARESLEIRLGECPHWSAVPATLDQLEAELKSRDGLRFATAVEALRFLLDGGFLLPRRRLCEEGSAVISALAQRANDMGLEPHHVSDGTDWERKVSLKSFAPRKIPAWGSNPV